MTQEVTNLVTVFVEDVANLCRRDEQLERVALVDGAHAAFDLATNLLLTLLAMSGDTGSQSRRRGKDQLEKDEFT